MRLPHLIGLCGKPGAGKSEVQKILAEKYGVEPVDDGHALRAFAVEHLGLSWEDVQTQAGKARNTIILGQEWQNRKILGDLGRQLETMFGKDILPYIATRNLDVRKSHSFGSVRMNQGAFYRKMGGIVIEVQNSYAKPSPHAFDQYDAKNVDLVIMNDVAEHEKGDPRVRRALVESVCRLIEEKFASVLAWRDFAA